MTNEQLIALEHRLAIAERDAQTIRAQVRELQQQHQRRTRRGRRDGVLVLVALALVFTVARSLETEAQGARQVLTVKAPFTVVDSQNNPIMKVVDQTSVARGIFAFNGYGHPTAHMGSSGPGDGVVMVWRTGQDPLRSGTQRGFAAGIGVTTQGNGLFRARNKEHNVLSMGSDSDENGLLEMFDATGKPLLKLQEKATGIGRGLQVFLSGGTPGASVTTDPMGGAVKVFNDTGVAVGALLGNKSGGGVELTGPAGGKSAVSIGVQPSGGKVRVFPAAGGTAHAELTAESSGGAMTLYTNSGAPSALLQTGTGGAGRLEISRSGTIFVEAGVANGRGIVRAGPTVGGPPIGALGFADTIMGKVK